MVDEKLSQGEFESLVNKIKGDCDKCKMDCRNYLRIIDSQIEEYRATLNEMTEIITQLKALYQINMRVLNIVNAPDKAGESNETNFTARFTQ